MKKSNLRGLRNYLEMLSRQDPKLKNMHILSLGNRKHYYLIYAIGYRIPKVRDTLTEQ